MSQGNIQLGISLICGGATYGLASVANLTSSVGIALAVAVGGIVLIALASKNNAPVEETVNVPLKQKPRKESKKAASPQKAQKTPKPKVVEHKEEPVEVPETPEKKKSKKKNKKSGTPATAPVSPQPVKTKTPSKVEEEPSKELTKNQMRKLKKKEADQKQKVEDEKQKAAELAKKAADQKREAAQQKKLQAKARKAAQKVQEIKPETKVEVKHSLEPEEGWEKAPPRKSRGPKDGKESKEPIVIDVKIPVRQHAVIIGKSGDQLRRLTDDLDVIITMPKRDSGNDLILIKGLPKDVYAAKKAMEDLATKGYCTITHPGWVTKLYTLQNGKQLAAVFGDKGSTFKLIQSATKTRLHMPEKGTKNYQVTVTGEEKDVEHAFQLIHEIVEQGYTKETHPDWVSEEVHVGDAVGAIIGKGGETVTKMATRHQVKIQTPNRNNPAEKQDVVNIRGPKRNVFKAKAEILDIVAKREPPIEQEIPDPAWQEEPREVEW